MDSRFTWDITCNNEIFCLFDLRSDSLINDDSLNPAALPEKLPFKTKNFVIILIVLN